MGCWREPARRGDAISDLYGKLVHCAFTGHVPGNLRSRAGRICGDICSSFSMGREANRLRSNVICFCTFPCKVARLRKLASITTGANAGALKKSGAVVLEDHDRQHLQCVFRCSRPGEYQRYPGYPEGGGQVSELDNHNV